MTAPATTWRLKTQVSEADQAAPQGTGRRAVSVQGVVQGVGFRPFVYRLAEELGLTGWVLNHSGGVEIEIEGSTCALDRFVERLSHSAPPLARIEAVRTRTLEPADDCVFEIRASVREEGRYQLVSPDIATCADCQRELFDPDDRRNRYPFTNCTNCGPRFTIITDIPYDRPLTTMRSFQMCPDCQTEYEDPLDRRFHAQPNACPMCGPQVWFLPATAASPEAGAQAPDPVWPMRDEAIGAACGLLRDGGVLAVKGLGGFHLACDATNSRAVALLRDRKQRPAKPLAVMLATLDEVQRHCIVLPDEQQLLTSPQCPVVLLRRRSESNIVRGVAPGTDYLGAMLPYTPLHHVLLRDVGRPLVMTSGNLSEEPISCNNDEAVLRLSDLADGFLLHNRDIHARYDDSVWFVPRASSRFQPHNPDVVASSTKTDEVPFAQPIRRSRGYAPFPIKLPFRSRQVLACGPELKNTFCLTRDDYAFVSQHIGDMENLDTLQHFEATVEQYKHLFRIEPEIIAHDLHPSYLSTRYAMSLPVPSTSRCAVQHHHAHVASCLADNAWPSDGGPVIGVAWDGTGYGLDGRIWGGEFLIADYTSMRRAGHLEYLPMPGGEAAIRNPYRLAIGYGYHLTGQLLNVTGDASQEELHVIQGQIDRGINCPLTSAAGRLFDAVAAMLGLRSRVSYEAQAAIELEAAGSTFRTSSPLGFPAYPFQIGLVGWDDGQSGWEIRLRGMFETVLADLQQEVPVEKIAYRFHLTAARMIRDMCERIASATGLSTVALSGGCFQNRLLLGLVIPLLRDAGLTVLVHRQVPCNDGGISLGQAVVAHGAWEASER